MELLEIVGVPLDKLSRPSRAQVQTVAKIASALDLSTTRTLPILAAWTQLVLEEQKETELQVVRRSLMLWRRLVECPACISI